MMEHDDDHAAAGPAADMAAANPRDDEAGGGRRVCVTGASGYIGSHLVRLLLQRGYRVRATVRDATDERKTKHLRQLVAEPRYPLELCSADLLEPGSYDDAVKDCVGVFHAASAVRLTAKDPQREIVDPAIQGTKNVLEACHRAGSVQRVVLTSSIAAIASDDHPPSYVFTEADWNDQATMKQPYMVAKTRAERWAWSYRKKLPADERFDLVALHPAYVFGPVLAKIHGRSSPALVRDLMKRAYPACPALHLSVVDVRDVALAHVRAFERTEATGRYLLSHRAKWIREIAQILAARFPDYPVPTMPLPSLFTYVAALLNKHLNFEFIRRNLGKTIHFDGTRATTDLGFEYRPLEETLVDTAQSFIDLGLVRPRRRK